MSILQVTWKCVQYSNGACASVFFKSTQANNIILSKMNIWQVLNSFLVLNMVVFFFWHSTWAEQRRIPCPDILPWKHFQMIRYMVPINECFSFMAFFNFIFQYKYLQHNLLFYWQSTFDPCILPRPVSYCKLL